uniref:Uncharacterized protein n=1 Tax=Cyphia crenata TaxID=2041116 RepID=A0A291F3U5_9ASTR|nr:hypothetical protein Cyp_cre1Pt0818 [Cyphia crenata]YP_009436494.1 hypothetical protein Cyp_cre1Pt1757 [Cyphia crenata]ATG26730.1 hypothetical protein Cyp_cre1Pt0818 [Cyphia crenata]ATG26771.1 hypothetical protein Cyp_cre1Pt1757 [Cyphia crenata]
MVKDLFEAKKCPLYWLPDGTETGLQREPDTGLYCLERYSCKVYQASLRNKAFLVGKMEGRKCLEADLKDPQRKTPEFLEKYQNLITESRLAVFRRLRKAIKERPKQLPDLDPRFESDSACIHRCPLVDEDILIFIDFLHFDTERGYCVGARECLKERRS